MYKAFSRIFSQTSASDRDLPRPLVPSQLLNLHDSSTQFFPHSPSLLISSCLNTKPGRHVKAIRPNVSPWLHVRAGTREAEPPPSGDTPQGAALASHGLSQRSPLSSSLGPSCPRIFGRAPPRPRIVGRGGLRRPGTVGLRQPFGPRRASGSAPSLRATGQAGAGACRHARYARPKSRVSLAPLTAFRWRP